MKLPQECPSCHADLRDRNPRIPAGYEEQFSLVMMDDTEFECPLCHHCWPRPKPAAAAVRRKKAMARRRFGNPARR